MQIYYIIISLNAYVFWPQIVAIFRDVFFEGILCGMLILIQYRKPFTD